MSGCMQSLAGRRFAGAILPNRYLCLCIARCTVSGSAATSIRRPEPKKKARNGGSHSGPKGTNQALLGEITRENHAPLFKSGMYADTHKSGKCLTIQTGRLVPRCVIANAAWYTFAGSAASIWF